MKKILPVVILALLAVYTISCGSSDKKKVETTTTDSTSAELALLNKQISDAPDNPDLYNKRAKYYSENKKFDEALSDINKALNLDSAKAEYFLTLSDIYFGTGKIKNCQAAIQKSINIDPEYTDGLLKMAELQLYFKEYTKTFEYINKALDVNKVNAKAYFMKGMTYKEMGDTGKAVSSFITAVDQDGDYYHAYIQLGIIFATRHNKLAEDYYNNALKLNPKSIEALYGLGMYYQEIAEYNKAIAAYDSILTINPSYKQAHFNLGYIHLVYLRVYSQAIKHFTNAISCDPEYAEAYYNRGYSYELSGDVNSAKADYTKALSLKSNYQRAIDGLNRIDRPPKK
jgi:tetratricopeptide (TPR) repeat protein